MLWQVISLKLEFYFLEELEGDFTIYPLFWSLYKQSLSKIIPGVLGLPIPQWQGFWLTSHNLKFPAHLLALAYLHHS